MGTGGHRWLIVALSQPQWRQSQCQRPRHVTPPRILRVGLLPAILSVDLRTQASRRSLCRCGQPHCAVLAGEVFIEICAVVAAQMDEPGRPQRETSDPSPHAEDVHGHSPILCADVADPGYARLFVVSVALQEQRQMETLESGKDRR